MYSKYFCIVGMSISPIDAMFVNKLMGKFLISSHCSASRKITECLWIAFTSLYDCKCNGSISGKILAKYQISNGKIFPKLIKIIIVFGCIILINVPKKEYPSPMIQMYPVWLNNLWELIRSKLNRFFKWSKLKITFHDFNILFTSFHHRQ